MARTRSRKSSLPARTNRRRNTQAGRKQMSPKQFALPGRRYRIDDLPHARNARARVRQHGTPSEQRRVYAATARKYPSLRKRR